MNTPDWSKAPIDATHYGNTSSGTVCYYKIRERGYQYMYEDEIYGYWRDGKNGEPSHKPIIPRPTQWQGPQDGLPPVGMVCEYDDSSGSFRKGEVLCHIKGNIGHTIALIQYPEGGYDANSDPKRFRPIQSDRDRAIEEMFDIVCGKVTITKEQWSEAKPIAYALYDAGFRKT